MARRQDGASSSQRGAFVIERVSSLISGAAPWLVANVALRSVTSVGPRARVYGRPLIQNRGEIYVADRLQLFSRQAVTELNTGENGVITIGSQCLMMDGSSISAYDRVTIGDRCLFGRQTQIIDCDFHHVEPERRLEVPEPKSITIGNNVWLASRVIVLPGVTIGDDSVVAAGSVVSRDVDPKTLVGGVPARKIRDL